MCFGGKDPPPPVVPPPPPPPPPVLEQPAPASAAPKQSEELKNRALGTKQYRSGLSIGTSTQASNNTGLGISS